MFRAVGPIPRCISPILQASFSSSVPPRTKISATEWVIAGNKEIAKRFVDQPFFSQLARGTLCPASFVEFLAEDYKYLSSLSSFFYNNANEDKESLSFRLSQSYAREAKHQLKVLKDFQSEDLLDDESLLYPLHANLQMTIGAITSQDKGLILATQLPCLISYGAVSAYFVSINPHNPYYSWAKYYKDKPLSQTAEAIKSALNQTEAHADIKRILFLSERYCKMMENEIEFLELISESRGTS